MGKRMLLATLVGVRILGVERSSEEWTVRAMGPAVEPAQPVAAHPRPATAPI
jgi:hypothetical protein